MAYESFAGGLAQGIASGIELGLKLRKQKEEETKLSIEANKLKMNQENERVKNVSSELGKIDDNLFKLNEQWLKAGDDDDVQVMNRTSKAIWDYSVVASQRLKASGATDEEISSTLAKIEGTYLKPKYSKTIIDGKEVIIPEEIEKQANGLKYARGEEALAINKNGQVVFKEYSNGSLNEVVLGDYKIIVPKATSEQSVQQYTIDGGNPIQLNASQVQALQSQGKSVVKYEKQSEGSYSTQINPVTGELIQTNSKTGEIKKVGTTVTKPQAEAQEKFITGKSGLDDIEIQLNKMESIVKKGGTAITSFGENPVAFLLNTANDVIKIPTEDRALRAEAQQFSDAIKIAVASSVQSGALTQKDVDSFNPFIISTDDDIKTIKTKIKGQREFIARKRKELSKGLEIYSANKNNNSSSNTKVLDLNKYRK